MNVGARLALTSQNDEVAETASRVVSPASSDRACSTSAGTHSISYLVARHRQHMMTLARNSRDEMERYSYPTLREFGADIADINRESMRRVYAGLKARGAKQVSRRFACAKRVLDWAADPLEGFLVENPMALLKPPKEGKREKGRTFTLDEARAILREAEGSSWHLPFLVYFSTGVRKQALMLRTGADWNAETRTLTVRVGEGNKVKHEDAIPVGQAASSGLSARVQSLSDPLFPSPSGAFYAKGTPYETLRGFCDAAGIPRGGCHAMRRCCATEITKIARSDIASLALGHLDGKRSLTQARYIHAGPEDARTAVEELERRLLSTDNCRGTAGG